MLSIVQEDRVPKMVGRRFCLPSEPEHDISCWVMGEQEEGAVQEKTDLSQVLEEQVGVFIFEG